jgi:transposase-like protein
MLYLYMNSTKMKYCPKCFGINLIKKPAISVTTLLPYHSIYMCETCNCHFDKGITLKEIRKIKLERFV